MKIEIYGIKKEVFPCYGCALAEKILNEVDLSYEFYQVINFLSDDGIPDYNRNMIQQLAGRLGQVSLNISYPVIFIDNERVYLKDLRAVLISNGYDAEE